MQSILIISKDNQKGLDEANKISRHEKIDAIDITTYNLEKSLGVEDVKEIRRIIYLTPIRSEAKSVIINSPMGATLEAQNSMLKILEEPPASTIIIIVSTNLDVFLPTILSRCKVIVLGGEVETNLTFGIQEIIEANISERLFMAQEISKSKEECLLWMEKIIREIDKNLSKSGDLKKIGNILGGFNKTYSIIKNTNANPRLALESLFISI